MDTIDEKIKQLEEEIEKLNDRLTSVEKTVNKCAPKSAVNKIEADIRKEKKDRKEREDRKERASISRLKSMGL
ncbi:hypothetical protein [Methanosarcina mazei]|uniref:Uncharacterized protein n=1 Tax=Methanosarcina mazei S-6 TaxID=213585 RepID=A0A0E3LUA3_METMZ|nr:hypothetical protein [Methanosarcina mazei]AKB64921.1 hypothetical protein MSMAS_1725 [Methanosarcina mazei S-6]